MADVGPQAAPVGLTAPVARRTGRRLRRLAKGFACVAAAAALAAGVLVALAHSLDRPWLKRRLLAAAGGAVGLEVDYRAARLDLLSGADVDGIVVRSPAGVRAVAPDLLRVGRLEVRWSLARLWRRAGPALRSVRLSDVEVTDVVDERGASSFDALSSGPPAPVIPLSRRASHWLSTAPPVGRVDVDHVAFVLVRTRHGTPADRTELSGLALSISTGPAAPPDTGWRLAARLGAAPSPIEISVRHTGGGGPAREARAKVWAALDATSSALALSLDLRLLSQTFAAIADAHPSLHADATLRFDPRAGHTDATLARLDASDGAATADGMIEVADSGECVVRRAHGTIDLARLLAWLPPGVVPVTAERASVRYDLDSLALTPAVRLSEGGVATVRADLSKVTFDLASARGAIDGAEVSLQARPAAAGAVAVAGSVKATTAWVASGDDRVDATEVAARVDGTRDADGAATGSVRVHVATLESARARVGRAAGRGEADLVARGGDVELRAAGLRVDDTPVPRGDLALTARLASLDARTGRTRVVADGLEVRAHAALDGRPPYAAEVEAPISRLRVLGPAADVFVDAPARLTIRARDLRPDRTRPEASRGVVRATFELGDAHASVDATSTGDAVDFSVEAAAPSLAAVRPLLPPALAGRAPWDRMALAFHSAGRVERPFGPSPAIRQTTTADLERPAFDDVAAQSLTATVASQGTARRHRAHVDLLARGLAFAGGEPRDERVEATAEVDRDRPSARFELASAGYATGTLAASLSFDASRRVVPYRLDARWTDLGPLAPLVARFRGAGAFDLSRLAVQLSSEGDLSGAVASVAPDGAFRLTPDLARTAAVDGTVDLDVAHFRWARAATAISAPEVAWHGVLHGAGARRTVDGRLEVGGLRLDLGRAEVDVNGIADETHASIAGSLLDPQIDVSERLSVRAVQQAVVPEVRVGDVELAVDADRSPEGLLRVSSLKLVNGAGGTVATLAGTVDLGDGRRTLALSASMTQDLARLSTAPQELRGDGQVGLEATVTSPDFRYFRVRGAVDAKNVTVALPRAGIDLRSANGNVPVAVGLALTDRGVAIERRDERSPYAMLRFEDQHPLFSRSSFLSVARLETPFVTIAPLVGNLEIDDNRILLQQFEMGVRGGRITGQCALDWNGAKSTVELHVRATGVQSSHGEPFDGNIAVAISAADRMIDGRAEILRIGERHLLDLLDLEDPVHRDPATNRVRTALAFGYPKLVRLVFDHGFATAHLELGGLARFVSIGDLRGIPMGPIFDKVLAPMVDASRARGAAATTEDR